MKRRRFFSSLLRHDARRKRQRYRRRPSPLRVPPLVTRASVINSYPLGARVADGFERAAQVVVVKFAGRNANEIDDDNSASSNRWQVLRMRGESPADDLALRFNAPSSHAPMLALVSFAHRWQRHHNVKRAGHRGISSARASRNIAPVLARRRPTMMPKSIPSSLRQIATQRATGTRTNFRASESASSKSPASWRAPSLVAMRQGVANAITSAPPRATVRACALELRRSRSTSSPRSPRRPSNVRLPLAILRLARASLRAKTTPAQG